MRLTKVVGGEALAAELGIGSVVALVAPLWL